MIDRNPLEEHVLRAMAEALLERVRVIRVSARGATASLDCDRVIAARDFAVLGEHISAKVWV